MLKKTTVMNHINVPAVAMHNDIMDRFFGMDNLNIVLSEERPVICELMT